MSMSNQRSNSSDGEASALVCSSSAECSTSSRPTNVSDCSCPANPGDKCPLCSFVFEHYNLERLGINQKIDAEIYNGRTFLKLAVVRNNLHAVSSMVYYGTIFEGPNCYPYDPLELALEFNYLEIARVLIHLYDDFYFRNENKFIELLVNWGGSDPTLFKLLLSKIDPNVSQFDLLLDNFLQCESICWSWSTADWLECVYLILANVTEPQFHFSWNRLFHMFKEKNVQQEDRLKLIYICLSFGYFVAPWFFDCLSKLYGFDDELEAFIYSMNRKTSIDVGSYYLAAPVLPITGNSGKRKFIYTDSQRSFKWYLENNVKLEIFELDQVRKLKELPPAVAVFKEEMVNKLKHIPEFPSLLELTRNEVRERIYNLVLYPYQFHDRVKQLEVPCILKDMILLKVPIYP